MSNLAQRVLDAAVVGQARSPRFIQKQLSQLHEALSKESSAIRAAIQSESRHSLAEVQVQYALALEVVASCFAESNFEKALHAEYSLSRLENAPSNSTPCPVAYIVPSMYNPFYSTVTAVATAISAGSCVILEVPKMLSKTVEVVREVLCGCLDRDTFVVVEKRMDLGVLPKTTIRLFGASDSEIPLTRTDLMPPSTRSIAIVDRGANMEDAVSALLRARFSFGGQSPLAPDLVLVNEFRVKEFCQSMAESTTKYFAVHLENGTVASTSTEKARASRVSSRELDQAGAEIVISGSRGSVARIMDRSSKLLRNRIQEPLLLIHPVRSVDDAIDFVNSEGEELLSAIFAFGTPDVVKYISQSVDAHLCCANGIPVEVLVGPVTPIGYPTNLRSPYSKDMFSVPKPEFIQYEKKSSRLSRLLDENDVKEANALRQEAELLDTKVKQPSGSAIGFFEQGILLGFGLILTTIVASNVVLWRYGVPAVIRRIRH